MMPTSEPNDQDLPRREREQRRREQEILAAAERVFCAKGYHGASMQEIADEAEYSVGTLYNVFPGKEVIYERMVEQKAREAFAGFEAAVDDAMSPKEKIRTLVVAVARHFNENLPFFRLYYAQAYALAEPERMPAGLRALHEQHMAWVADIFRDGIARGVFREAVPERLTIALRALVNTFLLMHVEHPGDEDAEVVIERMIDMFFHGVAR